MKLVKCPGHPEGFNCGSLVRPGRICGTCHTVKHNHPDGGQEAREAHAAIVAANDWKRR